MGSEKVFRVPCMLSNNGISVSILALPDSRAHGFRFFNRGISACVCSRLGVVPIALPKPITPKGYYGIPSRIITHFIVVTLCIDGYTLTQLPFLILDLGNQDIILGDAWMAHFDVLPDLRNKKLFWRTPPKQTPSFQRKIVIPRKLLKPFLPNRAHQTNAELRDVAIRHDEKHAADGKNSHTISAMPIKIFDDTSAVSVLNKSSLLETNIHQTFPVDIHAISESAYKFLAGQNGTVAFTTSLSEIDQKLSARENIVNQDEAVDLVSQVPQQYHDFLDVFSKAASNILPPSRSYDHKIQLEKDTKMTYGPLYNQSTEELRFVKQYLIDNLQKGWIELSQAPFSSPILFVKKPCGGLRFCIDYRKLNLVTKKDR
ncbi:hypothetical protein K3495_g12516 [Podosphaera aphanis]|nr:hypothetical protein K3495_g12516 [Podosphaera aphanis]